MWALKNSSSEYFQDAFQNGIRNKFYTENFIPLYTKLNMSEM